jgi:CheY-like chemotaxis protein
MQTISERAASRRRSSEHAPRPRALRWTIAGHLSQPQRVTSRAPRILVVEDDAATARVVKNALIDAGFEVETLDKGFRLIAMVMRYQPDLLLLDINLPDMRGDTAMKMVRRAAQTSRLNPLPVIVISGLPLDQLMEVQGQIGAVGCIQKPAPLDQIIERVRQVLGLD